MYLDSVQKATKKPIFLGEFGLMFEQGGGTLYLKDMYEICMENGWHFAIWDYRSNRNNGAWDYEKKSTEYWQTVLNMFKYSGINNDFVYNRNSNIITYPNPAEDFIYLKPSEAMNYNTVEVYSINGELIKIYSVNSKELCKLFVGDLSPGIYFLKTGLISSYFMVIN